jgi:hypothetical protein
MEPSDPLNVSQPAVYESPFINLTWGPDSTGAMFAA